MAIEIVSQPRKSVPSGIECGVVTLGNKANVVLQRKDQEYTAAALNGSGYLALTVADVSKFNGPTYPGALIYVSGLGKSYNLIEVDGNDVVVSATVVPATQTGFINNTALLWYVRVEFRNLITTEIVTSAKFLAGPTGLIEFNANSYIVTFEGLEHLFVADPNHSLVYRLEMYEHIDNIWNGSVVFSGSITSTEGKVQLAQNPNLWQYIWADGESPGKFLNTEGSLYIAGVSTLDFIFDFENIPASPFVSYNITSYDKLGNEILTGIEPIGTYSDYYLNHAPAPFITTSPGGTVKIAISSGLPPSNWTAITLQVAECQISDSKSVLCRWINERGAYNFWQFVNYTDGQVTDGKTIIPVYDDQEITYSASQTILKDETVYEVFGADVITVEQRTDNVELMRSLLNTTCLEVLQNGYWIGYNVVDGAVPTRAKNRSKFIYNFEFRKTRR